MLMLERNSSRGFLMKHLLLVLILLAPQLAMAQHPVPEGARIRVRQPPSLIWVGTLQSLSPDTVTFIDGQGNRLSLARQNVELERSIGRTQSFWKHFGLTVGGAALTGGIISAVTWTECNESGLFGCFMEPASRGEAFGWGFVAGGLVAVPLGVLLGAVIKPERWIKVGVQQ
jgi:hypothetical protein